MANILYDKTDRLPPAGSLREALFMTVYLSRERAEYHRMRVVAQGLIDSGEDTNETAKAFNDFVEAFMPYTVKQKSEAQKQLVDAMKKEATKGRILFKPQFTNILHERAKTMSLPDEFREKLNKRKKLS